MPSKKKKGSGKGAALQPQADPPAAPPPPPPPGAVQGSSDNVVHSEKEPLMSYHDNLQTLRNGGDNGGGSSGGSVSSSRQAMLPTIRNFGDALDPDDPMGRNSAAVYGFSRGDASLLPNRGLTNSSYDTASVCGLALNELLDYLRLSNIISSLASMLVLPFGLIWKVFTLKARALVLSGYLAFFSFVLFFVEIMTIWNVPAIDVQLRDNFGFLHHPVGKTFFIFLLSSLSWAVGESLLKIVSLVYFCGASCLLYAWIFYADFRKPFILQEEAREREERERREAANASNPWSAYSDTISSLWQNTTATEKASLVDAALRGGRTT